MINIKIIWGIVFLGISFLGGVLIGGGAGVVGMTNSPSCPEKTCPTLDTSNVHIDYDYLKKNACILYSNYKNMYLEIDEECNANYSCKGSAYQKEAYKTYVGWKDFYKKYCDE